jgi:hypothetical protein
MSFKRFSLILISLKEQRTGIFFVQLLFVATRIFLLILALEQYPEKQNGFLQSEMDS